MKIKSPNPLEDLGFCGVYSYVSLVVNESNQVSDITIYENTQHLFYIFTIFLVVAFPLVSTIFRK